MINVAERIVLVLAIGVASAGCGAGADRAAFEVRDSSGVRVAVSTSPEWNGDGEGWRVDPVPRLRIGVQEGEPHYQFFGLSNATRLRDGTVVASDVGSKELRFFSPDGAFLKAVGREGAGPGEFGRFSSLRICQVEGDRLAVEDAANNRINVFTHKGEFVNTYRLQPAAESGGRPPQVVGCLSENLLLGISWPGGGTLQGHPGDIIEGEMHYVAIDPSGGIAANLAEVATRPRFVNEAEGVIHYPFIPLSPEPLYTGGGNELYLSREGSSSVELRNSRGEPRRVLRWTGMNREPVAAIWDRFVDHSLGEIQRENTRRRYARLYAQDLPLPDSTPALQQLIRDTEGNLWAERYRLPWTEEHVWDVLDPEGRWLGAVQFPAVANVFEIGEDYALAREVDELGVERLVMLSLLKDGP